MDYLNKNVKTGDDSLLIYFDELKKYPLLTHEEEIKLAKLAREGNNKAFETLITSNLRFVVSIAKEYLNQGLSLGDLINEGNLGLITATRKFDENVGVRFITYAVWWIRQSIQEAMAKKSSLIKLPNNKVNTLKKIKKIKRKMEQKTDRSVSVEDIAGKLETNPETVKKLINISEPTYNIDSIDQLEFQSNARAFIEMESEVIIQQFMLKKALRQMLLSLSQREAKILELYYGLNGKEPENLQKIGKKFNITRERVRQIKEKAISRLRINDKYKLFHHEI